MIRRPPRFPPCPSTPLSRSEPDRQFFKSAVGLPEPWAARRETPLSHSFCQHVVATGAPLRIEDARQDPLVCDNLAVPERSEEHTSELQSRQYLVCRLLLEKKKIS